MMQNPVSRRRIVVLSLAIFFIVRAMLATAKKTIPQMPRTGTIRVSPLGVASILRSPVSRRAATNQMTATTQMGNKAHPMNPHVYAQLLNVHFRIPFWCPTRLISASCWFSLFDWNGQSSIDHSVPNGSQLLDTCENCSICEIACSSSFVLGNTPIF